jgi:hypothetical protein
MASKKSVLPIVAIGALAAFALMGSGTANASSKSQTDPNDGMPPPDGDDETIPPPDNGGQQNPNDTIWKVKPDGTPLTADEKAGIQAAMILGGIEVDPTYYPSPYNKKKASQSMLDWKTNLAFWSTYSTTQSPWVASGKPAVPFKLTKGMKDANKWAATWLKIRDAIAYQYPDIEVNPKYTVNQWL